MVCAKNPFNSNIDDKRGRIIFLTENILADERQKVSALVSHANNAIAEYFGVVTSFDIVICYGSWEMEVQVISREGRGGRARSASADNNIIGMQKAPRVIVNSVGLTDYYAREIIIRHDSAGYGHYLHELIHGVISKDHTHQLREGLAWYFTLKLTEEHKYVRPSYPSWVDHLYVFPVNDLARMVGDDFLKDLALGRGSLEVELLPSRLREMFLPEGLFYAKKRYFR